VSELKEHLSRRERVERDRLDNAWRSVAASTEGRLVLFDVMGWCGVYRDPTGPDSDATLKAIGEQNIGRRLIARLERISPATYPGMLLAEAKENQGEKKPVEEDESDDG
jgi:hypothetical protein